MNVDDEIKAVLRARADRAGSGAGLETQLGGVLDDVLSLPVRRRFWLGRAGSAAAAIGLAAVLLGAVALGPFSPLRPGSGTGAPAGQPGHSATPTATGSSDVAVTPPPHAAGTCPVTPITDIAGGTAPEVVTDTLHWRWGGEPWRSLFPEKVVLLGPNGSAGPMHLVAVAINFPASVTAPVNSVQMTLPGDGPNWSVDVVLPYGGCWLLTAAAQGTRGSVVVDVAKSGVPSVPVTGREPLATARPTPLTSCPASPQDEIAGVRTWLDGSIQWQDPDPSAWQAGKFRKLVVSVPGAPNPDERALVTQIVGVSAPTFVDQAPLIRPTAGGIPVAFDFTLPSAGCWAITYANPLGTSTIVVPVGVP